jgi:Glycosyltransferase Family 4
VKIAQIAPLMESVPPRLYGGTERVVSHLCEALVQEGHDVTLFASGDSVTSARLVACTKEAIRLNLPLRRTARAARHPADTACGRRWPPRNP